MNTIFAKILYELEKKHDLMLVTIISEAGSAPRGTGAQMLVGEEGRILGTIGGGPAEKRGEEMALELLREKRTGVHEFTLRKNAVEDIGSECGGDITTLLQYISGTDENWTAAAGAVLEQIAAKRRGWLIQHLDGSAPSVLGADGEVLAGDGREYSKELLASGSVLCGNDFAMPLPIGERAIIFGAGHCAVALAPLLRTVGFRVTVFDEREAFADPERFPGAEQVICGDFRKISDYMDITEEDYIVVMTSGHSHDYDVQEQVLRGPFAYAGVIGSRRKTAAVNARLREAGVPEEGIAAVHTPIGTAIKAVTPEEIAVSITGEMIYERALKREAAGEETHSCPMH